MKFNDWMLLKLIQFWSPLAAIWGRSLRLFVREFPDQFPSRKSLLQRTSSTEKLPDRKNRRGNLNSHSKFIVGISFSNRKFSNLKKLINLLVFWCHHNHVMKEKNPNLCINRFCLIILQENLEVRVYCSGKNFQQ